jgi:2'-5' RNA ligase
MRSRRDTTGVTSAMDGASCNAAEGILVLYDSLCRRDGSVTMGTEMGCEGEAPGACHFALVSYIPGRLAAFLDRLRFELKPGCVLRSHVTVLPPRPIDLNIDESIRQIKAEGEDIPPFTVELGPVAIFDKSNVVYLTLRRGERELHAMHENLNAGQLEYDGPFPYHPHITLAQDLTREQAEALAGIARERWAAYDGLREFTVDELSFVRSYKPGVWLDLAYVDLAQPVSSGR